MSEQMMDVTKLDDKAWIDAVVNGEDTVQREDMHMCDLVQGGLNSPAYDVGRWGAIPAACSRCSKDDSAALCMEQALPVHLFTVRKIRELSFSRGPCSYPVVQLLPV